MSNPSNWKAVERALAKLLGGERIPVTGRVRGDSPDIEHEILAIEVKARKRFPKWLTEAIAQAVASAKRSKRAGNVPIVILHQTGKHHLNDLVILKMQDFIDLLEKEK